jgi:gas vesicle protein
MALRVHALEQDERYAKYMEALMDYEQERDSNSGMTFITGLFAGALIGTGIGLLFAPRKGSELREQLSDAATSMGKTASKAADDVVQKGRVAYDRARDVASRASDDLDRVAGAAAKGMDEGLNAARDVTEKTWQAGYRATQKG